MNQTSHSPFGAKILVVIGNISLLIGALDPLEGGILILLGSGLTALGTYLGRAEAGLIRYRTAVFVLVTIGVGAMWALTAKGGVGGSSGRSMWWGLLLLPYLVGWLMALVGPGNPPWFSCLGIGVGVWYFVLCWMVLARPSQESALMVGMVLAGIALATIGGCLARLTSATRHLKATHPPPPE